MQTCFRLSEFMFMYEMKRVSACGVRQVTNVSREADQSEHRTPGDEGESMNDLNP